MPLITTSASLSKQGFFAPVSVGLENSQTLAYFSSGSGVQTGAWIPTPSGNTYFINSSGVIKLNVDSNIVWQFTSTYPGGAPANVDSSENVYTGANGLTKYNSSGVFQWTTRLIPVSGGDPVFTMGIQFDASDNVLVLYSNVPAYNDPSIYTNAVYNLVKYSPSGTVLSQRRIMPNTSSPAYLGNDPYNSCVLAVFKSWAIAGHTGVYNAVIPYSNTTSPNDYLFQTTTTGSDYYEPVVFGSNSINQPWIVSDGSYYYQVVTRQVSGVFYYVFCKFDRTTGAISYSKQITSSGDKIQLYGIAVDTSSNVYVLGKPEGGGSYYYVGKFDSSGNAVWEKTVSTSTGSANPLSIYWMDNFLYIRSISNLNHLLLKLADTGSLANGTYGTYFTIASTTSTLTTVNSSSTGINSNTASTTTFTSSTPTGSTTTSAYTLTTIAI